MNEEQQRCKKESDASVDTWLAGLSTFRIIRWLPSSFGKRGFFPMIRPTTLFRSGLLLATVLHAQIDLPIGKDLDPYLFPAIDTLYLLEEGLDSLSASTSPDFAGEIRKWTEDPSITSVRVDTANRVLHYTSQSIGTVIRANGSISGTEMAYVSQPGVVDYTKWLFDTQGRRVSQIFGTRSGGFEFGSDTIVYDWSRSGCPDELWADTKREWSVDAEGRCIRGTIYAKSGNVWGQVGLVNQLVWVGNHLSVVFELEIDGANVDTLAKDVYYHDNDGNWTKVENFKKTASGTWRLDARSTNEWGGGKFTKGLDTEYDDAGNIVWSQKLSTVSSWTSSLQGSYVLGAGLVARVDGSAVEFSNREGIPTRVRIVDPEGRSIGELTIPPRGSASWNGAGRHGVLFWSALTSGNRTAGRLVLR